MSHLKSAFVCSGVGGEGPVRGGPLAHIPATMRKPSW